MLKVFPTNPVELTQVTPATLRALQALCYTSFTPIFSGIAQNDVFRHGDARNCGTARAAPTRAGCASMSAGVRGRQTKIANEYRMWSPLNPKSMSPW